jgi:hypothetical protein
MPRSTVVFAALCLAVIATAAGAAKEPEPMPTRRATGSFTVKMRPPDAKPSGEFALLRLDKQFDGALKGTSVVEMVASNAGDQPAGGYVALERFTGALDGREGTFVLQHSGTMSPGAMHIDVLVTPGSGTGALAGIEGRLAIRIEGKQHFYDLDYALPE